MVHDSADPILTFGLNVADNEDCLDNIYLSTLDRWIFYIGGSITLFTTFFLIVGSIRFKALRQQPGDLIVGIAISDFIISIHWIILARFYKNVNDDNFCRAIGAFGTIGGITEFVYNSCFSLFLIISLRNALKQASIPQKTFHIITVTIAAVFLIRLLYKDEIGKTSVGTCSIKSTCQLSFYNYIAPGLAALYAFLGSFTYYYVKKNLPKCAQAHSKRTDFLLYYLRYNVACTIIYFFIAITNVISTIITNPYKDLSRFRWVSSLYNFAKLSSPLVLTFIRCRDPTIRAYIWRTVFFWKTGEVRPQNYIRINDDQDEIEVNLSNHDQFTYQALSISRRVEIVYTILSCVIYANKKIGTQMRGSITPQTADRQSRNRYKHEEVFMIKEETLFGDIPDIKEELEREKYNILPGTLKIYSSGVFSGFVASDRDILNILESLQFNLNREQIKSASGASGGKSGEFFFFSSDKKLIIKTVPDVELKMLISILERYELHYNNCPNSLIAKIYGAYTYENTDLGLKFNLIVMKNMCGFPSQFVERVYDMKGSRYDREVLKGKEVTNDTILKDNVLKDADFERFEQKLYLEPEFKPEFLAQIALDSTFLRNMRLIDYSFMVFFVNKKQAREELGVRPDFTEKNPIASMENINNPGMYYNIGIIDYLQPYNFQKAVERIIKRIKKLNPNLDTSSQNPEYYSDRFINFMKRITE